MILSVIFKMVLVLVLLISFLTCSILIMIKTNITNKDKIIVEVLGLNTSFRIKNKINVLLTHDTIVLKYHNCSDKIT